VLQRYLKLEGVVEREQLPPITKTIEPGDVYPGAARLEQLLRLLGDLDVRSSSQSMIYQGPLVDAVRHFQARHGLDPDGRFGKATFRELSTPLKHRVRQIELTLERWRWLPTSFSRPPIVVNIPEFRLYAVNDVFEAEFEMKVVVGKSYRHQTPVFRDDMTHVIFRPYWNVPLSIQRAELVPKISKDASYLVANGYEVVDRRGQVLAGEATPETIAQLRSGTLTIRQKPGSMNALGLIKFMFPNEYNVYLHGTPAMALFSKSRRDFSHGCIRVEKPEELAAWVLRGISEWTPERIFDAQHGAKTLQVNLPRPIPVLIFYGTAVVREDGEVSFFHDIYGHDKSLDDVLN
jgi:murein L,D-transpeptidase YcbB/YkuD